VLGTLLLAACKVDPPEPLHPGQDVPEDVPPFLDGEELERFLGHQELVVLDARPARAYRRGHVPGAVHLEWTDLVDGVGGPTRGVQDSSPEAMAELLGGRGLSAEDWVVVVGDPLEYWGEEGRIAWALTVLGQRRVSVLDGGWSVWLQEGRAVQRGRVVLPPADYRPAIDETALARKADVQDFSRASREWSHVLVDVREPGEFRGAPGAPRYGALRAGHIPGAVSLPWRSVLDDSGRLRPPQELETLLVPLGVRPDAHLIVYCTGGVRSAHTWWVLHSLGYPDVRNYAGSWWEWAADRKLGVEKGGQRLRPSAPPWPPPPQGEATGDESSSP